MTYYPVPNPYQLFTDTDGTPLESGYIYIGEANLNPITNPITVSWDLAGLYPAAQPIRTIGGYPSRNGTPGILYVNAGAFEDYSILIQDKHQDQVTFVRSALATSGGLGGNTVDIIDDLRTIQGYDQPIYVRGHSTIGDGGEGKFEWIDGAAPGTYVDDDGITIVPTGGDGSGAWIRSYSGAVNIQWFGAIGDYSGGTGTDNTTAIQAAIDADYEIIVPAGFYLISDTITLSTKKKIKFIGAYGYANGFYPAAYFVKDSTMTTAGIQCNQGSTIEGGGVLGEAGNSGDGIQVVGGRVVLKNVWAHGAGDNGIRIGNSGANCNDCTLIKCVTNYNGGDGLLIHFDNIAAAPDCNLNTILQHFSRGNTGHGIHIRQSFWCSIINVLTDLNTGYGLYISNVTGFGGLAEARYHTIVGGDYDEGNTAGSFYFGSYRSTAIIADNAQNIENVGSNNSLFGTDCATRNVTGTSATMQGTSGSTIYPLIAGNYANASNGRGVGVQFNTPDVSPTPRTGGQIACEQETTNKDRMRFTVNNAGSLDMMAEFSPNSLTFRPGTDLIYSLGYISRRWNFLYTQKVALIDGITAPPATSGHATLYVDVADGDLKIIFGDGTIKTIVTDT